MSILDGPGEGTWSVFAMKVVEQRDEALEENARLIAILRDLTEWQGKWASDHFDDDEWERAKDFLESRNNDGTNETSNTEG